jgi:hypothetical protein
MYWHFELWNRIVALTRYLSAYQSKVKESKLNVCDDKLIESAISQIEVLIRVKLYELCQIGTEEFYDNREYHGIREYNRFHTVCRSKERRQNTSNSSLPLHNFTVFPQKMRHSAMVRIGRLS